MNATYNRQKEDHRIVDEARIYQKDDDGEVDRDTFVDVDVPKEIAMKRWGPSGGSTFNPTGAVKPNDPTTSGGSRGGGAESYLETSKYAPAKEADNIEIKKRDVKKKADL